MVLKFVNTLGFCQLLFTLKTEAKNRFVFEIESNSMVGFDEQNLSVEEIKEIDIH